MDDILAFIPARGGSKTIPRKNIKLLGNKPLIVFSIESAFKAGIEHVFVDTEDDEIAKIAYENVVPLKPEQNLKETLLNTDIHHWRDKIFNDFESSIFKKFPEIKLLKERLYSVGAIYASLSGSGSSVFGIFEKEPTISFQHGYSHFLQKPNQKIL